MPKYESTLEAWLRLRERDTSEAAVIAGELESVVAKHKGEAEAIPLFPWRVAGTARAFEMSIANHGFAIMLPSGVKTWPELIAWSRRRSNAENIRLWARSVRRTDRWRDLFKPQDLYTFFVVLRVFTSHRRESNRPRNERLRAFERDVLRVFASKGLPWRASPKAAEILADLKARCFGKEVSLEPDRALKDAVRRFSGAPRRRRRRKHPV